LSEQHEFWCEALWHSPTVRIVVALDMARQFMAIGLA
jgi:hypothetical protein